MTVTATRRLIVTADDFGLSKGVNDGILAAHDRGIVTSTSLMVRWPDAVEAAASSRGHSTLSVGLHVDLGEWQYREGEWRPLYEVVAVDNAAAVEEEVVRQIGEFRRLVGRDPTHLDSHQHVHKRQPVQSILTQLANELSVPLRHLTSNARYCGDFYGQSEDGTTLDGVLSVDGLSRILASLKPGVTELCCHPSVVPDVDGMYREERVREFDVLCDPRIASVLADERIELISFAGLEA
jgi:predicted glycoside hydrolase/deacetylase ChbG (UPF0249 family)